MEGLKEGLPRPERLEDCVLVTHMGCMDGSGCAIMFLRAGGKKENIFYVAAGMTDRFMKKDFEQFAGSKFVIFGDIGFSEESSYPDLLEKRGSCVLLDHHKTALHLSDRRWCDVRMDACGTELVRRYLVLEDPSSKALAALIMDHDIWLRKDPNSERLASFTVFAGQDVFVERFLDRDVTERVFTKTEEEMMRMVEHRRDGIIDQLLKKTQVREVAWHNQEGHRRLARVGYVISSVMDTSLFLDRMCSVYDIDIACQINVERNSVSLRSRNGYDVSEFAAAFGGGGHKAASGHRLAEGIVDDILSQVHS